jgi:hypothetical protein
VSKYEVKGAIKEHDEIEKRLKDLDRFWRWLSAQKPEYVEVMCDEVMATVPVDFVKGFLRKQGNTLAEGKKQLDALFENMTKLIQENSNDLGHTERFDKWLIML